MLDGIFYTQLRVGKVGEEAVLSWLRQRHDVRDVREDKEYQKQDIDFIVDEAVSLEIKTDNNISRTGNIYIETYKGGWYEYCGADYLGIYSPQTAKLYILDYQRLKSILPTFGRTIKHIDKDTNLAVPATLLSISAAKYAGAITQEINLN